MIELVTIYHPDKMADFVAESLLHKVLEQDPSNGRAAFEVIIGADPHYLSEQVFNKDQAIAWVFGEMSCPRPHDIYIHELRLGNQVIKLQFIGVREQDITLHNISKNYTADQAIIRPVSISEDYLVGIRGIQMKIIRNSARCKKCGVEIESKYTHNWVRCECPGMEFIYVDGGHSYQRWGGNPNQFESTSILEEDDEEDKE